MRDPRQDDPTQTSRTSPAPGALRVVPRDDDVWEFEYTRLSQTTYDVFHNAIDSWEAGRFEWAEERYRQLLADYPEFIDVYHHLAMLLGEVGREDEAYALWQQAVAIGLGHLPGRILSGSGTLAWRMLDNRPFLRAYHGLGLAVLRRGRVGQALEIFLRLLDWNPDDNQGIRALAVECHFRLRQPRGVVQICERYPGDGMEDLLYGRPLALVQLGELDRAREALAEAIGFLPLVGQELAKSSHRKPKGLHPDRVALFSPEQAHLYWRVYGRHWKRTPGALDLVRQMLGEPPGDRVKPAASHVP